MSRRGREAAARWIFIAALLAALEGLVRLDWVNRIFLTAPSLVAAAAWEKILSGELPALFVTTLFSVGAAFALAAAVGLPVGYALWRFPSFGRAYDELLSALFASPWILLYPIFLVIFGRGLAAVVAMGFLSGMIPIALNTHHGLRDVSAVYLKMGAAMRLKKHQIVRHILFPAAAPMIVSGLKLGVTYILISVIAIEFLVEIGGIGTLASKGYFWFNTEELYLGVAGAIVLSMIFIHLLGRAESRLFSS